MDGFQRAFATVASIKTPITVTALIVIVFYYLISQMLSLSVFTTLTQSDSSHLLEAVLSRIFWLAVLGLVFGGVLFALPYVLPNRRSGAVTLVDASLNQDLSSYSQGPDGKGPISPSD